MNLKCKWETVEDSLVALIAKMGEKITIGRTKTFR